MTVGTANFYKLKGSLSAGEYPLLASGQNLSTYRLNQATVRYAAGLQTSITVPIFTNYQDVNVIEIGGSFYWATAWQESTTYNGSVTYLCDYMAPTSLLKSGQSISAYLERSPTYICTYLSDDWTKGETSISDLHDVGADMEYTGTYSNKYPMYWVQITGVDTNGDYKRYGCFVYAPRFVLTAEYGEPITTYRVPAPNGDYPSIKDIINDVATITPFTADSVKDISISRRCPYVFTDSIVSDTHKIALGGSGALSINPTQNGSSSYLTYDIESLMSGLNLSFIPTTARTITFTPGDKTKMSGSYVVRDWNKNIIANFPVEEGSTFYVQTYSDFSGIYTLISNTKRLISIPEGKLPYGGSGWDTYLAYSMTADRQAMANAIGYADRERLMTAVGGTAESIIGGALTGALASAPGGPIGAGIGVLTGAVGALSTIVGAETAYSMEIDKLRDTQKLTELRAKNAIGTGYNVGYGLIYVTLTAGANNFVIGQDLPINAADAVLQAYVDRVGYPCEGLQTLTVVAGFYKGYIPTDSNGQGMFKNELNRVMRQGFKFVSVS